MDFIKISNFKLMKIGKTNNDFELKENIVKQSIINHTFDNKPIIYNKNQEFNNYENKKETKNFINEKIIGLILTNTVNFDGLYVTADIILYDNNFSKRTHFDNWLINYDNENSCFEFESCELFSETE